jgi:hypothetical protein
LCPVVIDGTWTGKVEVAEDSEGECSKVRKIDAADSFQEERTVVEAASFFVRQGEDKSAQQEEEDDGLMSGEEEAQRGAIEKVGYLRRTDAGEVMEDDGEGRYASQGIELVKASGIALLKQVFLT